MQIQDFTDQKGACPHSGETVKFCLFFCKRELTFTFANVNSRSRSLYAIARPSVCLSVCLSVTLVHPTQAVEIFGNISAAFGTLAIRWHPGKNLAYGDRPRGTPLAGELNARGIAKYSDFGPIEAYISETVQCRR